VRGFAVNAMKKPRVVHSNIGSFLIFDVGRLGVGIWFHPRNWILFRMNLHPCNRAYSFELGPFDLSWDRGLERWKAWQAANPDFRY
jgi:hypothetical protein